MGNPRFRLSNDRHGWAIRDERGYPVTVIGEVSTGELCQLRDAIDLVSPPPDPLAEARSDVVKYRAALASLNITLDHVYELLVGSETGSTNVILSYHEVEQALRLVRAALGPHGGGDE